MLKLIKKITLYFRITELSEIAMFIKGDLGYAFERRQKPM